MVIKYVGALNFNGSGLTGFEGCMRKRSIATWLTVIWALLLCACNASTIQETPDVTPAPTPIQVTASDLLADALRYYEAGDYEEAIITYLGVIKIEPRNFDAQLGLGKAYRSAGKPEEAIAALLAARELDQNNADAACELGYLYLEKGQYAEAERIAASIWENNQTEPEAGIVLALSLAGQGKTEELQTLLENQDLRAVLEEITEDDSFYIGEYDENGERDGNGTALYPGGYVYVGDYAGGIRSGQGIWYYPNGLYYVGEWAEDMPNGSGELVRNAAIGDRTAGTWANGLEHGEMESRHEDPSGEHHSCSFIHWKYQAVNGVPQEQGKTLDGTPYFSGCQGCGEIWWTGTTTPLGIRPFTEQYEQKRIGTSAEE